MKASTHPFSPPAISYRNYTERLLALLIIVRLATAAILDLGNDEAYYWLYSLDLQWNYFDHPPMVAVWIRIFTLNGLFDQELFLRLGSIAGSTWASWAIYNAVSLVHSSKAGWYTACLYNASFYAGITAGIFIMPDTPQMVFWTTSLWMIARITVNERSWKNWILFGITAGLCIMSKVLL